MLFLWSCKSCKDPVTEVPDPRVFYAWNDFAMGADLSYVNAIEDYSGIYRDSNRAMDPYGLFRRRGCNLVRVRLWNNPQWHAALHNGRIYNDLTDVTETIRRAKQAGMAVLLDLHYSDTWADPAHQETPAAWAGLPLNVLKDSVYQYTARTLQYLHSQQLTPEMIQIGNETNGGMMFPVGRIQNGNNATAFAALLNSGIKAVRDFSATSDIKPRIVLHVAQYVNAQAFIETITQNGVSDFDILGISHYENWSEGYSLAQVESLTRTIRQQYQKDVMVVETACPWTSNNADDYPNIISGTTPFGGFAVSATGQLEYMKALTQAVMKGGGKGVIYWEPAWITSSMPDRWGVGSSWENNAFFDFNGNTLPVVGYMTFSYQR